MRVSVVICTVDRGHSLRRALKSLEFLDHPEFEVIVVTGPSTDSTEEVLAEFAGRIKVGRCRDRNLSRSRNIGIALAAGDLVAFLDDDAYPDPLWLNELVAGYDSEEIAGVGGPVYNPTGVELQARYSIANRFGRARVEMDVNPTAAMNSPYSLEFPYLIGTNASFLRRCLVEIGGFDEEYDYFLDETDVCCRLVDLGWVIRAIDRGFVYHKFLSSAIRNGTSIWGRFEVVKNTCYFALKHGLRYGSFAQVCEQMAAFLADQRSDYRWNVEHGNMTEADYNQFEADIERGFDMALELYRFGRIGRSTSVVFDAPPPFQRFETKRSRSSRLHVCLFSQEWPPMQLNGIARVVHSLAYGLADDGHVVHVLTRGDGHDQVDLEDGVWVHRIVPKPHPPPADLTVPTHIWHYSASLLDEVRRIHGNRAVDLVHTPNWDSEGVAVMVDGAFTTVLGLHTPLKTVRAVDPAQSAPSDLRDQLVALEEWSYTHADALLASGPKIVEEIERSYGVVLPRARLGFVPHGLPDISPGVEPDRSAEGAVKVLFVGRLERRKGIDVLLECIPSLVDEFPDLSFTIVGNDRIPQEDGRTIREIFENSAAGARVGNRVMFRGVAETDELAREYASCQIFVAPSRFESFGLVLLEAMMFGKPIVGCDVGGMADIVEDGGNGFLVRPGDVADLRAALARLASSADLRSTFGARSRELFEQKYAVRRMVDGVCRFYRGTLGRSVAVPHEGVVSTPGT